MSIIKVLGTSQACNSTPNTFSNSVLVRVVHSANTNESALVTCKYANAAVKFTIGSVGGNEMFLQKSPTDTLESNNATTVTGVSVAFTN